MLAGCALIYRKTMHSAGNMLQIALGNEVALERGCDGGVRFAGEGRITVIFFRGEVSFSQIAIESYAGRKFPGANTVTSTSLSQSPALLVVDDSFANRRR